MRRRPPAKPAAALAATALALSLLAAGAADRTDASPHTKIDPELRAQFASEGTATFMVDLDGDLDLPRSSDGEGAYEALKANADAAQRPLADLLESEGTDYESYWVTNSLKVTADEDTAEDLAGFGRVERLRPEGAMTLDEPVSTSAADAPEGNAWGVEHIGADRAWDEFGATGEGVVVANIDSGVDYTHPSLIGNYRGANGDGTFDHEYNWFDPAGGCAGSPCDTSGHGTHVMGTIAGSDGIGVAPGATWMAAKGCESDTCSESSLVASAQWLIAPTDAAGENPRPDLAPDVVNNSWGGGRGVEWFPEILGAWEAAGIFVPFAAGNAANGQCSTVDSPGDNAGTYTVGAIDENGVIGGFSGRGPSMTEGKPDIAAPGIDVVSAVPGGGYAANTGTSMAAPHAAGAAALLWSAAPDLYRDRDATAAILGETAVNVDDTSCGGDAERNHVYGEGVLDVYEAVSAAPHGETGSLSATVTDGATGEPIADANLAVTGENDRTVATDDQGSADLRLSAGTYEIEAYAYGYERATTTVEVAADEEAAVELVLAAAEEASLSGTVTDAYGRPRAGAEVRLKNTPLEPATADAGGRFAFDEVAAGTYDLEASPGDPARCMGKAARTVDTADGETAVELPWRTDALGWSCRDTGYDWQRTGDDVALMGDEDAATVDLPFPVSFYGGEFDRIHLNTNGILNFSGPRVGDFENQGLGTATGPNGFIAPFWDDMAVGKHTEVSTGTSGAAGERTFTVTFGGLETADGEASVSFQVVFAEEGGFTVQYRDLDGRNAHGDNAVVGIEAPSGTVATAYSEHSADLFDGLAVHYDGPAEAAATTDFAAPRFDAETAERTLQTLEEAHGAETGETPAEEEPAEEPSEPSATARMDSDNGLARRLDLPEAGGQYQLNQYGTVARLDENGERVWRNGTEGIYEAWGVTPARPWDTGDPAYLIPQGLASVGPTAGDAEANAVVHDFTGDGVEDLVYIAYIGETPSFNVSVPGWDGLYAGTMVTLLDGATGELLWSDFAPKAETLEVVGDTLVVADNPVRSRYAAGAYRSKLYGYAFDGTGFDRAWTVEGQGEYGVWADLKALPDGRVAAADADALQEGTARLLVLDAATGETVWETEPENGIRELDVDEGRGGVIATEQTPFGPGLSYSVASYALADGERTEITRRHNAYASDLRVADVRKGKDAEYLVAEVLFDFNGAVAAAQERVVDGDGDQPVPSMTVKRSLGERGDGPLIVGTAVEGSRVVLNWASDDGRGRPGFREAGYSGGIGVFDAKKGRELWRKTGPAASPAYSTTEDGTVTTVAADHTAYTYRLKDGGLVDKRANLGDLSHLAATEVDGDGTADVIAGGRAHGLFAFDGTDIDDTPTVLWNTTLPGMVHDLKLGDVTGDGREEAVAATGEHIVVMDTATGEVVSQTALDGLVWNVELYDLDGDGAEDVLTGASRLTALTGSGERLWSYGGDEVVFSTVSADRDGVFATYGADENGTAAPAMVALDHGGREVWTDTPDDAKVGRAMLWNSVLADPAIPYADGHAVAVAWQSPVNTSTGRGNTVIEIRDARTGEIVLDHENGGEVTHIGFTATSEGLLQQRFYGLTVYDGTGAPADSSFTVQPWAAVETEEPDGRTVVAGSGRITVTDTETGESLSYSSELSIGSVAAVPGAGVVFGAFDQSTYDLVQNMQGSGYWSSDNGRRGLEVWTW